MENIIAKSTLIEFWKRFPDAEPYLTLWYNTAMRSDWNSPSDVKQTFATASILKNGRVIFNIKGNTYRLVAKIRYKQKWIFIRFVGTHGEYDKIDANEI